HCFGAGDERSVGYRSLQTVDGPCRLVFADEASLAVEEPGVELDRLSGPEPDFRRRHLEERGIAFGFGGRLVDRESGRRFRLLRTERVDGIDGCDKYAAA